MTPLARMFQIFLFCDTTLLLFLQDSSEGLMGSHSTDMLAMYFPHQIALILHEVIDGAMAPL